MFAPAVLFFSCKKDENKNSGCAVNVSSVSGSYKFTAYKYRANSTAAEQDYFNIIFSDPCERDDVLTLNSNGSWILADAGVVCTPPGDDTGIWSLTGNTLNVDGDLATIESFDCKTLVLLNTDVIVTGDKVRIYLTKQ